MAYANGIATIDFGVAGSHVGAVTVTGQATLIVGDKIEAWIQGTESTADNNAVVHKVIAHYATFTVENVTPGVSFDIAAISDIRISKTIQVSWVRST